MRATQRSFFSTLLALVFGFCNLAAQDLDEVRKLAGVPVVRRALELARTSEPDTIAQQVRLCEVAAPPFGEAARGRLFAELLRQSGLTNVRSDAEGNVVAVRRGVAARPHLVLSAHLDTVFPAGTPVSVTRKGKTLYGPGITDNCRGVAVVVAVARLLQAAGVSTRGPISFVGTVGEEGLGDLRGVKALLRTTLPDGVDRFVAVDGDGFGITHEGIGSRRYRVTFRGPGGHSYDDFGRPSPVHAVGSAIAELADLAVPFERTTFNVGRVGGGTSINSIANEAWLEVDLRSHDPAVLDGLDLRLHELVRRALDTERGRSRRGAERLSVDVEPVGSRPAARIAPDAPIVRTATAVLRTLGLPVVLDAGSTDANVPMSLGIPAIRVGAGGVGRDGHTPQESFDTTGSWQGTRFVTLLAIALAN
jgi:acetylornithine deacetylase/succinyl-diaminopimelate desuccinylase-like protein